VNIDSNDELPQFAAVTSPRGSVEIAPATITFLTVGDAKNPACD
jgi:peptidyl-tRNA hydrolase